MSEKKKKNKKKHFSATRYSLSCSVSWPIAIVSHALELASVCMSRQRIFLLKFNSSSNSSSNSKLYTHKSFTEDWGETQSSAMYFHFSVQRKAKHKLFTVDLSISSLKHTHTQFSFALFYTLWCARAIHFSLYAFQSVCMCKIDYRFPVSVGRASQYWF